MARVQVLIRFPKLTDEQRKYLFKAERQLVKAGVSFDTGQGKEGRDWEFDWSLTGAEVYQKRDSYPLGFDKQEVTYVSAD